MHVKPKMGKEWDQKVQAVLKNNEYEEQYKFKKRIANLVKWDIIRDRRRRLWDHYNTVLNSCKAAHKWIYLIKFQL